VEKTLPVDIRELRATDREAAIELWEQAGLTRPWNDPARDFDRALGGPTSTVLGAVHGGAAVATVMVGHDGHRGWVYYLAVAHERRHGGLGRRMMREAERWLRERGAVKLQLMVRDDNPAALGFYQRLGYEDAETTVLARWLVDPGPSASQPDRG
jgi:ribosomal protein S18 acetylase RimI-like enzyme